MNPKTELMVYLKKRDEWVASQILSDLLQVSTSTIRKFVKEINMDYQTENVILSSSKGYKLNQNLLSSLYVRESFEDLSDLPEDRLNKIIQLLIKAKCGGIHIYDISEQLYVSESTVRQDIRKIKDKIEQYCLDICIQNDYLYLQGSERDKRKLIKETLYEEAENSFYEIFMNQNLLKDAELDCIKHIIAEVLKCNGYTMNEYAYSNLLLHIIIAVERLKTQNHISESQLQENSGVYQSKEYHMAEQIFKGLHTELAFEYPADEVYFLSLVLIGNMTQLACPEDDNSLEYLVRQQELDLLEYMIQEVNKVYLIDLNSDDFKLKFILHLKNLIARSRNQSKVYNPMLHEIRIRYPLTYDLAVFLSDILQRVQGVHINEDEIGYIAIHLGTHIENQKRMENKLKGILICPRYLDLHTEMMGKLEAEFSRDLVLVGAVTELSEGIDLSGIDLIITTVKCEGSGTIGFVEVLPFLGSADINRIQNEIQLLKQQRELKEKRRLIRNFIRKELFFKNISAENKNQLIDILGEEMKSKGYVDACYMNSVHERERISSTAFQNVAVPHSIHMDALQTAIAIIIYDKAFQWGDNKVDVVVMLAVNNEDRELFGYIFELIIEVLSESRNIRHLKHANTYEEFIEKLMETIRV